MPLGFKAIPIRVDPFGDALKIDTKIRLGLRNFTSDAQRMFSSYPKSQGNYRRTGALGRKWTTRISGTSTIRGRIGNRTTHAPTVQGPEQQKRFKEIGWKNVDDVEREVWRGRHKLILQAILKGVAF